jgi:hypothetical protein
MEYSPVLARERIFTGGLILSQAVQSDEVQILERDAPAKLTGGAVIDGFPGMGLASTILFCVHY